MAADDMKDRDIRGPEAVRPEFNISEMVPGARALRLSRRDFLKVAGVGSLAFLAACSNVDQVVSPTSQGVTEIAPTLSSKDILAGTGEFVEGDPALAESLDKLLSESFNIEIPAEAAVPFSVTVGGAKFDFVSLAPLENKALEISWDEKIFMRVDNVLADLDKKVVTVDGKDLVVWSYIDNDGDPEPILWHPLLSRKQWLSMTPEQKRDLYAGFAPPTPLEGKIPGFVRSSDQIFAISFAGIPDGAYKVLAALAPVVTPEPTAKPEVEHFKVTTIENYKDQVITVEQLFDGTYKKWLESLPPTQFDPNKINDVSLVHWDDGRVFYSVKSAPNFTVPGSEPFNRNRTFAYCTYQDNEYIIMPIEYRYPDKNQWVITANNITGLSDAQVQEQIAIWKNDMNITPWVDSNVIKLFNTSPDPLVALTMAKYPNLKDLVDKFADSGNDRHDGDRTALNLPGIVLLNYIAKNSGGWLQ